MKEKKVIGNAMSQLKPHPDYGKNITYAEQSIASFERMESKSNGLAVKIWSKNCLEFCYHKPNSGTWANRIYLNQDHDKFKEEAKLTYKAYVEIANKYDVEQKIEPPIL